MKLELVEPLRMLFKDEVRRVEKVWEWIQYYLEDILFQDLD